MVKYLSFHNSFFCLQILFHVTGKATVWHILGYCLCRWHRPIIPFTMNYHHFPTNIISSQMVGCRYKQSTKTFFTQLFQQTIIPKAAPWASVTFTFLVGNTKKVYSHSFTTTPMLGGY
jgi:hypothetical protein